MDASTSRPQWIHASPKRVERGSSNYSAPLVELCRTRRHPPDDLFDKLRDSIKLPSASSGQAGQAKGRETRGRERRLGLIEGYGGEGEVFVLRWMACLRFNTWVTLSREDEGR